MNHAADSIAADEFLLRRVNQNRVDPGPPIVIGYVGFRPTPEDTQGLSVYREKFITAAEFAAGGRKAGEYYVVRLSVTAVTSLGLTVISDEHANGPAGHALIPELSFSAIQRDKRRLREVQVHLAALASQAIVQCLG
jgi:hypothetical protein